MIPIAIVAAVAQNGIIGRDNGLAWRLRSDLRRFKEITWGKPMIMGRKTFDSIGKPLPGRETVVVTRNPTFQAFGIHVAPGWEDAKRLARELASQSGATEVAVVGGAEIYRLALPEADRLHMTIVHASPDGDVAFPNYDREAFRETGSEDHPAGVGDDYAFTFLELRRRT